MLHLSSVHFRRGFQALAVLSVVACASNVETTTKALSEAKPCCASFDHLPPAVQAYFDQNVALQPSSPHFDFGLGLAPFARLSLHPPGKKVFEVRASSSFGGTIGDGTFHFPDVRLIFLDSDRKELVHEPPLTASIQGNVFVSTVRVPENAESSSLLRLRRLVNAKLSVARQRPLRSPPLVL
jgi:hypothetical protein